MFEGKSIGIVIPCYNEEQLVGQVIETMPDFVDRMFVIDDCSTDETKNVVKAWMKHDQRICLIEHSSNLGLGQSLIDGYECALEENIDVTAVMAGDAQMAPEDLPNIIRPVVEKCADYTKGNRLLRHNVTEEMPTHRFYGNAVLTLLTKFATGYWQLIDPQSGYTAISSRALREIPIKTMIKGYGYNAHILNMLNLANFRVKDVEIEPVYGRAVSSIKLLNYIRSVSKLLVTLFAKRLFQKYLVREFHPLVFFYAFGAVNALVSAFLALRFILFYLSLGEAPQTTLILLSFTTNMALLNLFFGIWMDMEDNRKLQVVDSSNYHL